MWLRPQLSVAPTLQHLPVPPLKTPLVLQVSLPSGWFICVWLAIVVTHVLCAVYLIVFARIYWFFLDTNMIYWAKLIGGVTNPYYNISGLVLVAIGVLHLVAALWILWSSICVRKLVFKQRQKRRTESMPSRSSYEHSNR